MKTSELEGAALDWAVTRAHGSKQLTHIPPYSTEWVYGGPIIEREGIALYLYGDSEWNAHVGECEHKGTTPLIAAMRCYVASKLGDEVQIPEEMK